VPGSIAVIETITLGGVEQYLTIRGVDSTNPVLLFLHGGPGMPSSPWATWNGYHAGLEENFVVVHWDQRGAGKSYSEDLTPGDMQLEDFVNDTLELANILRERFDQEKIFLWGHSWGSGLGFETLRADSEPFYAFFASGVRPVWDESIIISYEKVLDLAEEADDTETIEALEAIQPLDPKNPEHFSATFGALNQYLINDFHEEGAADAWLNYIFMNKSPEYPANYILQTMNGQGFNRQTIYVEILDMDYDHFTDFPVSPIPVHFFHGRYDYATPGELAEQYYNALEAPDKSFTWFEDSAHDIYYEEADKFNQELTRIAYEILAGLEE
jgi:pimeloyl-ACP methyl ester carboxylesterase